MTTITLLSQKGGVGKTTVAINLSYSLANRGWRVLLVDGDLQGGVGFSLTEKAKTATGYYDFLTSEWFCGPDDLKAALIETRLPGLALLTRGSKGAVDHALADPEWKWASSERIGDLNSLIGDLGYDVVLYDTPTGAGPVSLGVAKTVDYILVAERPEPLCLRSMPQVLRMVASVKSSSKREDFPRLAGFLLSMADSDESATLSDQREFRDLLPSDLVFETVIPKHRDFQEASRAGVPVAMLRERPSPSSLVFDQLAAEFELRINLFEDSTESGDANISYDRLVD